MIGGIIAIGILILVAYWIKPSGADSLPISRVYQWGVFSRILGTTAYMYYAYVLTGGNVDAFIYDNWAATFAEYFQRFDFSPFTDKSLYRGGKLFSTNFVAYPAAFFLLLTFNSIFGIYLLFSTCCFAGLVLMLNSFYRNFPYLNRYKVTSLVLLFPAVWFWTSTIGKDAFIFLAIGVVCDSFRRNSINYFKLALGLGIAYAFRPQVAYMAIFSVAALFVFSTKDNAMLRFLKIAVGIVIVIVLLDYLGSEWNIESFDLESIENLQQQTLRNNYYGTGALEQKSGGISSILRGIVDVLARPFLWEFRDITTLLASLEINFMLLILWLRRRSVALFIRSMFHSPLSMFVGSFVLIYIVSAGLFENNIGLIARHRSILFPFLFLAAYSFDPEHVRKPVVQPYRLQKS